MFVLLRPGAEKTRADRFGDRNTEGYPGILSVIYEDQGTEQTSYIYHPRSWTETQRDTRGYCVRYTRTELWAVWAFESEQSPTLDALLIASPPS